MLYYSDFEKRAEYALEVVEQNLATDRDFIFESYQAFIRFFSKSIFSKDDILIGALSVYGWMPTMLNGCNIDNSDRFLEFINKKSVDNQSSLAESEIFLRSINNSIVGTSKFLHFRFPNLFPIIDSRINKYLGGPAVINEELYKRYFLLIHDYVDGHTRDIYEKMKKIESRIGKVEPLRGLELALFLAYGNNSDK